MKKEKTSAVLYYIASFCFYVAAIINFTSNSGNSMGVVWLCLGSTMLCLGSVWLNKIKKSEKDKEEKR